MTSFEDVIHRKKLKRLEIPGHVRYLTCSCFGRLPLFNNDQIKRLFREKLKRARELFQFRLYAWVIMPEHIHLLLKPKLPEFPVSRILQTLKGGIAGQVLSRWRKLQTRWLERVTDSNGKQHFWLAGGGYDRNIESWDEFEEKFHYIHLNPVRRGLVVRPIDWEWSSARWYYSVRTPEDLPMDSLDE